MSRIIHCLGLLITIMLTSGCGNPNPTPTRIYTPTFTLEPTETFTPSSTPTFTLTPTSTHTSTPTPTYTPEPALDILNWHLALQTTEETSLLRCEVANGDTKQQRLEPIGVTIRVTLITAQIFYESLAILRQIMPELVRQFEEYNEPFDRVIVLLEILLNAEQDLFVPFAIAPTTHPDELRALGELEFYFRRNRLNLTIGDRVLQSDLLPDDLNLNQLYEIAFPLENLPSDTQLTTKNISLSGTLMLEPPFINDYCDFPERDNYHLSFIVSPLDSRRMPSLYGEVNTSLAREQIDRRRINLLFSVVPRLLESSLPEITSEPP